MIVRNRRLIPAVAALAVAGAVAGTVAGCQAERGPGQNEAVLVALAPSRACQANLPFFGHYQYPDGRFGMGTQYAPAQGDIAMSNDGGWCAIRHEYYFYQTRITPELRVTVPPAHGEAIVGSVAGVLRIVYRPAAGFTGADSFELRLGGPDPFTIPVRVSVSG